MKKIDLYLIVLSLVMLALAIIKFIQDGEYFLYLLIAIAILIRSIKQVVSKTIFNVLGILATITLVMYMIFYFNA